MNWYYADGQKQNGPISEEELKRLADSGRIEKHTLVWREGMASWQSYEQALQNSPPVVAPVVPASALAMASPIAPGHFFCAECRKSFPASEMIKFGESYICATCKPIFFQRLQEGGTAPGMMNYAGFGVRLGAKLLDGLIIGIPLLIIFVILVVSLGPAGLLIGQLFLQLVGAVLHIFYQIYFLGSSGATPGKKILKIKVVTADGKPLGYGLATGRTFAEWLSQMICYIGYFMAGFDDEKRTLHDRICNTRVIHV